MKLTYFQLEPHLAKNLASIYIVSGDEILLKQEAIHLLRKAAKRAGYEERIRFAPEAGYDWDDLYSLLNTTSLFAEKRLLEFDFRDHSPNKTASQILKEYGENPASNTLIILDINKVDDKIAKSAWYKSLEKAGMVITIWPIPREQLPQWIITRAKKYKMQLQLDAANLLADYVEGNLIAAAQALEKIYLLNPKKEVDANLLHEILTDESRFTIFDFVEHLIAGDKARTLHVLNNLKEEGIEPILILWAVLREFRLLYDMAQHLKQGTSLDVLFQQRRIFAKRQQAMRRFLSTYTPQDCLTMISRAAEIDQIIKGALTGNVWQTLEVFCLR